jgi:hypothetical protein
MLEIWDVLELGLFVVGPFGALGRFLALDVLELGRFFGFLYEYLINVHAAEYVIKPC